MLLLFFSHKHYHFLDNVIVQIQYGES